MDDEIGEVGWSGDGRGRVGLDVAGDDQDTEADTAVVNVGGCESVGGVVVAFASMVEVKKGYSLLAEDSTPSHAYAQEDTCHFVHCHLDEVEACSSLPLHHASTPGAQGLPKGSQRLELEPCRIHVRTRSEEGYKKISTTMMRTSAVRHVRFRVSG